MYITAIYIPVLYKTGMCSNLHIPQDCHAVCERTDGCTDFTWHSPAAEVCCLLSAVCCLLSAVSCLLPPVSCLLFPPPVMCHVSHVTCHVSHVMCHVSLNIYFLNSYFLLLLQSGEAIRWTTCLFTRLESLTWHINKLVVGGSVVYPV